VSRTVILLGLVSLVTDLSPEMVTAVLPLYLTYQVRLRPLQFGFVGPVQWRVAVLDQATLRAHTLAETRNVRDQVEWLDDDVVYGLPENQSSPVMDVWRLPAAGGGKPQRLVTGAWSPAVVRS
jgi:hypothetical protein